MSNSASISAAKKRRGGAPLPMGNGVGPGQGMNLPPGLPPNFRQLPPQVQQQIYQQLQQRAMAAAAAKIVPPAPQGPQQHSMSMPPAPIQTRVATPGVGNTTVNVPGPYTVNPVIHNRAMSEVEGIHIRDLPISAAGLPCLPSGAALPPNVLFKLHHDELLNMDAILNEHSNRLQMLSNRLDKGATPSAGTTNASDLNDLSYDKLVNNTDFITKILDNILTNTNLSDIINQIEPLQKENESLRSLLNSQQTTLNELSGLVMKLLANGLPSYVDNHGVPHDSVDVSCYDNSNVFASDEGHYSGQEMTESNYDCIRVEGIQEGSLEEVVECMEVVEEDDEHKEDEEDIEGTEA